ncbi:MAG: hypothetical protein M3Q65_21840 [Chloroflexota bacterium]|nr:hypothetical protein [Chloroflexota bacterium]
MLTSYFEREALAQARYHDLLADAAERRRAGALRGDSPRERMARTLVALAARIAPAPAEAPPTARVA